MSHSKGKKNSNSKTNKKPANSKVNKKPAYGKSAKKKKDIRNIIFKDINEDYAWGKYGDFKVIIMKENGYINVTKMIHAANPKKKFNDWYRGKNADELTNEVCAGTGFSAAEILVTIPTGPKNLTCIRGTYAHPDLIPHIAAWASPAFAIKISKIVNEYYTKKVIKAKDKLIQKKDDKIDELLAENRLQTKKIDKMGKQMKRLLSKNDELYGQNEEILHKVDHISNDRVVRTGKVANDHLLVILKNNDDPDDYDDDDTIYEYHALRVMRKSMNARLAEHAKRHPQMEVLSEITYSPNSINLWNRIKDQLGTGRKKKLFIDNCRFNLRDGYEEKDLISDIQSIHDERFDTEGI